MSEIIRAARRGDFDKVRSLLEKNPPLASDHDSSNWTPLHRAAQYGHKEVVELLLAGKADVNSANIYSESPLHQAAEKGHQEVVELLLARGANANAANNLGFTPLHLAAQYGHKEVAGLLLANAAAVNAKNNWSLTPLHLAASNGHRSVVALLLTEGAVVNAEDIPRAAAKGHKDVVELLQVKKAEIKVKNDACEATCGRTAFKSNLAAEDLYKEFRAQVMGPVHFNITLACPSCNTALIKFSCPQCGAPHEAKREKTVGAVNNLLTSVLQALGLFLRPLTSVMTKDLEKERTGKNSIRCDEVLLARRYQERIESHDQAALCYVTWLKRVGLFYCPDGFVDFVKTYKASESAHPALRREMLDVAFVKGCETWSDYAKHSDLIAVSYTGSEVQLKDAQFIGQLESLRRSRGSNTDGLRELLAFLSRLGLPA